MMTRHIILAILLSGLYGTDSEFIPFKKKSIVETFERYQNIGRNYGYGNSMKIVH